MNKKVRVVGEKNKVVYMKYLQCRMALDKADGAKWKPYNEVKATSLSKKIRCYGTVYAEFSKVRGKVISHYYPTNKAHICYNLLEEEVPTSSASWSGTLTSLLNTPLRSRLRLP